MLASLRLVGLISYISDNEMTGVTAFKVGMTFPFLLSLLVVMCMCVAHVYMCASIRVCACVHTSVCLYV